MLRSLVLNTLATVLIAAEPAAALSAEDSPAVSRTSAGEAAEVLRLPEVLALTLESSPELAPSSAAIRAAEARALQAGLVPNPHAGLEVEDVLGSGRFEGGRRAQTTLQLSQLVELGGKRDARRSAGSRSVDFARAAYEERRIEVLADATARFVEVVERQHGLALASEAVRLDDRTLRTLRRRIRGGAGSPLEEKRAEVALARSRLEEEDARHELEVAATALAASWGAAHPTFDRVEADLFARRPAPAWEELQARLAASPELHRRGTEERLRKAELRLARARGIPDVTVSGGPRRSKPSDDASLVFGLSLPLPVFDRNQGGISEAAAMAAQARAETTAAGVRLQALLYRLWQELRHAGHVLHVLEDDILPAAEAAEEIAGAGFGRGRFSHLERLDARRALLEARRRRIEAAASFHRFVLEIERVTGAPIGAAGANPEPGELP